MTHEIQDADFVPANVDTTPGADPELSVVAAHDPSDPRMRPTIIVIAGLPRSGKDTFINTVMAYAASDRPTIPLNIESASSVHDIKGFLDYFMQSMPGLQSKMREDTGEYTQKYRDALAQIKGTLDSHFDFTYRLAEMLAADRGPRDVFFFQVRETYNIRALQYITNANFLSVHVVRKDRPETPLAISDKFGLSDYDGFKFDYVISSRMEDMEPQAIMLYNRLARITEGTDHASNLVKRTRKVAVREAPANAAG